MNERIAQIIAALGIKKIEFAKKIGISSPFVSELCTGAKRASDRTIADICREFNINETWLRTGGGEMFAEIPETLEDKLAKEYKLDDLGRQIMAAYLKLDESDRRAVGRMIQNLMDARTSEQKQASAPAFVATTSVEQEELNESVQTQTNEEYTAAESDSEFDPEIEADVEKYRRSRYEKKEQKAMLQTLKSGGSATRNWSGNLRADNA